MDILKKIRRWLGLSGDQEPEIPKPVLHLDHLNGTMNDSLTAILRGRLAFRRSSITELRFQLNNYVPPHYTEDYKELDAAERRLDTVEVTLSELAPKLEQLEQCREELEQVNRILDRLFQKLGRHTKAWEIGLSLWALCVLSAAGAVSYLLWVHPVSSSAFFLADKQRWPNVRLLLLCAGGGLAGTAIDLSRILYRVIPSRSLDPRRILWYFSSPFYSAALAAVAFLFLHAGTGFSAISTGTGPNAASVTGIFSLGFLIGFVPSAVVYRINGVVKAFFGTDEVSSPQITPPQVVRTAQTRLTISATVTPSGATRIVSATARIQVLGGTSGTGGNASAALHRGLDNTWSGELTVPALARTLTPAVPPDGAGNSDAKTSSDSLMLSDGTVTVEAQDETGNVSRSETVSLPPFVLQDAPVSRSTGILFPAGAARDGVAAVRPENPHENP